MENTKVFHLDEHSKTMKRLSSSMIRIAILPIIDAIVLILVIPTLLFVLSTVGVHLSMNGSFLVQYILIAIFLIVIGMVIGIIDFIKYMKIQNSILIKDKDNMLFLYKVNTINSLSAEKTVLGNILLNRGSGIISLAGLALYLKGASETSINKEEATTVDLEKIIENPRTIYKFYTDCKFIEETKKYFLYNGNKVSYDGKVKNENFKVDKIYEMKKEDI